MPPKKGGKGKGKGKSKVPSLIDGVDLSAMNEDQLRGFALKLKNALDHEREERNYFQLERDKIRVFWEVTRGQLEDVKKELLSKDNEKEMTQELADMEKTNITQQMKHLQYETYTKVAELRAEAMTQLKLSQESAAEQEQELQKDKRELRRSLRERDQKYELQLHQMKIRHNEELTDRRFLYENETKDMALMHEQKMQVLKTDIELVSRMEMFEVEERKNMQIQRLVENHEQAFNDMKNYYNDITLNNLGLISSLKDQLETLRKQAERSDRIALETSGENRRLKEPLDAARTELHDLRRKLEHYNTDRMQLSRIKQRNAIIEKKLKSLNWETEVLLLRNETLIGERDELKKKFDEVFAELQKNIGLESVLLHRKIAMLEHDAENREALFTDVLAACGPKEAEKQEKMAKGVEHLLNKKNAEIADLRYEVARVCKAHDDLLAAYESKLKQYDIPAEDLGFEPMRFSGKVSFLCGSAGLITKNK